MPLQFAPLWEFSFPKFKGFEDFFGFAGGAEFPDEGAIGREERKDGLVIERAGERGAVIAGGPLDIMNMAADEVGRNGF